MSKTREIDVWVRCIEDIGEKEQNYVIVYNYKVSGCSKAKLTVEQPEKKIEITESEFDEARMRALGLTTTEAISNASFRIKKELGF
jgi:hypothetical protein